MRDTGDMVVPSEVSWSWLYLPPAIFVVLGGIVCATIVGRVLNRLGWSRYFWHPPLAMVALSAIFAALIGLFVLAP
ncbi:MAG: DUF1656 domain-containing protein [Planctomycetota bacterium]|jgi:hypothetical protein